MVDALLEASARILVRDGYPALSTNRVAEEAGVSVGSLYQYYPNKEALLVALMQRWAEGIMTEFVALRADLVGASLEPAIARVVEQVLSGSRRDAELSRALLEQVPLIGAREAWDQLNRRFAELMVSWLERHVEEIEVDDLALAAHVLVTSIDSLCNQAILYRPELLESPRFQEHMEDLAIGYLAPSRLVARRAARQPKQKKKKR